MTTKTSVVRRRGALRDLVLDSAIDLGGGDAPPSRFRIAAFGDNKTSNGTFTLSKADAAAMVKRSTDRGIKQHADYEHSGHTAKKQGGEAPASAWYDLELGDDGLYAANIEWTPRALERLKSREYRYTSPWFLQREDGSVAKFVNFTLTNRPATDNLPSLVATENDASDEATTPEKPKMETLLKTLMLSEDADEAQAVAKVNGILRERDAIFTATETKDLPAALAQLATWKADAAKTKALETELSGLKAGHEKKERELILDEAVKSGAIEPNMKDFWASDTMSLDQLKAYVEKAPKKAPGKTPGVKDPTEKDIKEADLTLSEDDKHLAKLAGATEEEFAKHKKLVLGRV